MNKKKNIKKTNVKSDATIVKAFRKLIKLKMQEQEVSKRMLSKMTDTSPTYIGNILKGIGGKKMMMPSVSNMNKILKSLKSSLTELDETIHGK